MKQDVARDSLQVYFTNFTNVGSEMVFIADH